MDDSFTNTNGVSIIFKMIKDIQDNKQYLSDIDGQIGDGDHGINMNKGFTLCEEKLKEAPVNLSEGLKILSNILMMKIGGSMGPLYGLFFKAMAKESEGKEVINADVFQTMLVAIPVELSKVSKATPGDKTLMDCLIPAVAAYQEAIATGESFKSALMKMKNAAVAGRDSTKDMISKVGRSSRLGERSIGVIDAGSASCCIIFCAIADAIFELLN
ncbi:MAG TPA: dihydroxyacetone kinase subunit L [Bacteroidetes bacterium]|nr:dihydroxyacetone kinase subunit L [Bacteroidota bacterium]